MSSNDPILIVGGGIGGLATALALGRMGFPVRVFEQAEEFGAIGYGIQLGPNVFHMFDQLGLSEQVRRAADYPANAMWRDAYSGREVTRVDTGGDFVRRFNYPYIIIHRVDLHNILLNACRAVSAIEFAPAATVTGFEDHGDHVVALVADGTRVRGQAMIAADGLRSRMRAQLFGDVEPRMIGWVAHRVIVPIEQAPDGVETGNVTLWGGAGFHIVHYPLRKGTVFNIVAVFRTPTYAQRGDIESYRAELLKTYANAHPLMRTMIDMIDLDRRWPIADRNPVRHWHTGRVTLLGDAAHATLQALAQGGCMAVEDGVGIARSIGRAGGDFPAAFRAFARERVIRTSRVTLESPFLWWLFHLDGPTREKEIACYRAMSRDDVWDALAWLYNGYDIPAASPR